MDFLIDRKNRSLEGFYKNSLIPLSFYGFGSIDDLLNMKRYELKHLDACIQDEELIKMHYEILGVPIKD